MHYKDLKSWQKAMDLTAEVYRLTKKLPKDELYGLTNQLRRAAVSIPSNIAEGNARFSTKEYLRFLSIARGSVAEVETQLLICVRLEYLTQKDVEAALSLQNEVERMLNSTITKLRDKESVTGQ
ncbi:MAG: four helix bundle protein [Selenomonadaceae bacterium]|nr:four helix bundle protein [Selenomonadaceae bacterium]